MFRALLDTCVLFKPLLCDTLLCIAEEGVYLPMWSDDILDELRRNLIRYRISERAVEYRIGQMTAHFPTSMVIGHQTLTGAMTNSAKDRHVLAAAVRGHADVIVTENVRDFPPTAVDRLKVGVSHQDTFLLDQLDLDPAAVGAALGRQVSRYRREPRTVDDLLVALARSGSGCPAFAAAFSKRGDT